MTKPDWAAFGPEGGVDGWALQEIALKHGVLRETTYNPAKHREDNDYGAKPGDPWFVRNYK